MKYKLAVFDMDGTILNTLEDLKDSVNYALSKNNLPLRTLKEVNNFVGNGIPVLIERAIYPQKDQLLKQKVYEDFTQYYHVHNSDKTCPYDGINQLVSKLKQNNVKIAVVSNKDDYAVKALAEKYFPNQFDLAIGRCDGVNKKPAPDMVNLVLNHFNINRAESVYIGDSDVDFLTAENSQLDFIGVSWGFKGYDFLKALGTKVIVNSPTEIFDIITNNKN